MSHSTVGFFVGGLVIDENTTALAPIPKGLDGKVRVRVDSELAGGGAANGAVTYGMLAKLDKSNGGGLAHLYTRSEARTPHKIIEDLERRGVHLKKTDVIDQLGLNTVVSHDAGKKLVFIREPRVSNDTLGTQRRALEAFERLRSLAQQRALGEDAMHEFDALRGAMGLAFSDAAALIPGPAENWSEQFSSDLEGSSVIMMDMHYPDITLRAAKEGREHKIPVVLDLGRWAEHAVQLVEHSDIVIASHDFSLPGTEMRPEQILDFLIDKGIRQAAVTRGEKSTLFFDADNPGGPYRGEIIVPKESKLVSTSGAGDVMHGAACYFMARGRHFGEALWQANRVSSFSTSFPDKRQFFDYLSFDAAGNLHINDPFVQPPGHHPAMG